MSTSNAGRTGKIIPFPVVRYTSELPAARSVRPARLTVDVRRFSRALASLLFGAAGVNSIFAAVASVYILGFDQLFALAALLVGFALIFVADVLGSRG